MTRRRGSRSRKSSAKRSGGSRSRSRRRSSRSDSGSVVGSVLKGIGLAALFTAKLVAKGIKKAASRGKGKDRRWWYDDECREVEEAILERAREEGLEGEVPPYVLKEACIRYKEGDDLETIVEDAVEWWEETEAYRRSLD